MAELSFNFEALSRSETAWLLNQEAKAIQALLPVYERALDGIYARLVAEPNPYKAARLQAIQAQLEDILDRFEKQAVSAAESVFKPIAQGAASRAVKTRNELLASLPNLKPSHAQGITELPAIIPQAAVRHLATMTGLDFGVLKVEIKRSVYAELSQSVLLGESTAKQVARLKTVVPMSETGQTTRKGYRARLETIARTNTAAARSAGTQEAHEALNKKQPGSVRYQMIIESIRKTPDTTNHYFSFAVHGVVRRFGEPFKVSAAEVEAARFELQTLKGWKKMAGGGIFWPVLDGYYQGASLPAHYNDRGTMIPWAPDYQLPGITPKHPQIIAIMGKTA